MRYIPERPAIVDLYREIAQANLILTTPEKWDSVTR
jgi:replicative superfamily II helicase